MNNEEQKESMVDVLAPDLEELTELCKDNPEAGQLKGREIIEKFILSQPKEKQARFRAMQFAIDNELSHYIHPIAKMNHLQLMMQNNLLTLSELWNDVVTGNYKTPDKADVIEINSRNKEDVDPKL